ncbi:pectinesterase inhibitor-like [Zingiber officinale]|uniref:Pectinesterase inhibitor domain-containing protein n=1 Tax=Zingiber officinale TaxID=94328 RepID=A0A8J5F1V1_ZINOF|nr:pectinesterase inhibitor-like [Zingiber officinale]KAG6478980.1 hypothetical protein ZIOFF_062430 [Zingiber officinale]
MTPELPLRLLAFLCLLSASPAATALCVARNASDSVPLPTPSSPSSNANIIPPSPTRRNPQASAQPGPSFPVADDAIAALCGKTDYPDVCVSWVRQLGGSVGGGPAHDALGVLSLQMQACRAKVDAARAEVSAAVVKPGTDPRTASNLQVCSDSYDDAVDNLDDAEAAVKANDKGTMNSMLSALVTDFSTCEDSFSEMNAKSPQAATDDLLTKMASNCLALASLL